MNVHRREPAARCVGVDCHFLQHCIERKRIDAVQHLLPRVDRLCVRRTNGRRTFAKLVKVAQRIPTNAVSFPDALHFLVATNKMNVPANTLVSLCPPSHKARYFVVSTKQNNVLRDNGYWESRWFGAIAAIPKATPADNGVDIAERQ